MFRRVDVLVKLRLRATGCHLPYEITKCYYLSHDTSEHIPPKPQPEAGTGSIYLLRRYGRLSWPRWPRWFIRPQTVTHLSTNILGRGQFHTRPTMGRGRSLPIPHPIYSWRLQRLYPTLDMTSQTQILDPPLLSVLSAFINLLIKCD